MPVARSVGRPRDPGVDRAILEATRELLRETSYAGLHIGEVATRAGVTPPTVRLRWRTKVELVHDALFREVDERPLADTGSLAGDLRAAVRRAIALYTRPEVQAALLGFNEDLRRQPDLRRQLGARVYAPAVDWFRRIVDHAVARGEIARHNALDPATLMHTISGTVLASLILFGGDAKRLERDLVGLLLHGMNGVTQ